MLVRFARLCVPFLIVSSALSAQEASSTQTAKVPAKETCNIGGVVVKLGTNEPLSKAHVSLYKWDNPRSGYSTQTDGSGHFAIEKVEPGRYRLQVQRTGYLSQFYGEDPTFSHGNLRLNPKCSEYARSGKGDSREAQIVAVPACYFINWRSCRDMIHRKRTRSLK